MSARLDSTGGEVNFVSRLAFACKTAATTYLGPEFLHAIATLLWRRIFVWVTARDTGSATPRYIRINTYQPLVTDSPDKEARLDEPARIIHLLRNTDTNTFTNLYLRLIFHGGIASTYPRAPAPAQRLSLHRGIEPRRAPAPARGIVVGSCDYYFARVKHIYVARIQSSSYSICAY